MTTTPTQWRFVDELDSSFAETRPAELQTEMDRLLDGVEGKGLLRYVRTRPGEVRYDEPIDALIVPHPHIPKERVRIASPLPPIRDFSAWGERGPEVQRLFDTIDHEALRLPPKDDDLGTPAAVTRLMTTAHPDPRTLAALQQVYEYHDPITGLTQKLSRAEPVGVGRWRVGGIIGAEDASVAGKWEKVIDLGTEPPGAFHGLISLHDRYQGQGFGERLLRHEENAYIAVGVGHIDLLAGLNVGGYAWARAGFDWHASPGAMKVPWYGVRRRMEEMLDGDTNDDEKILLRQMLARFESPDVPTPQDIAAMGLDTPTTNSRHLGKRILQGTEWEARKTLVPPLVLAGKTALSSAELLRARMLSTAAEAWFRECQARDWELGDDGLDWNPSPPVAEAKGVGTLVRHVRTPEGHRKYGEQIGEIIRPDLILGDGHWKPLMTVAEADQWAAGSKLSGAFYHGAHDVAAARAITQSGFDISHLGETTGNAGFAGAGFYLTGSKDYALNYAHRFGDDGGLLETRVNVRNPMPGKELWAWLSKTHPAFPESSVESAHLSQLITDYAKSKGYDAIYIAPRAPGGPDELVLFNPRQVTVVHG